MSNGFPHGVSLLTIREDIIPYLITEYYHIAGTF